MGVLAILVLAEAISLLPAHLLQHLKAERILVLGPLLVLVSAKADGHGILRLGARHHTLAINL